MVRQAELAFNSAAGARPNDLNALAAKNPARIWCGILASDEDGGRQRDLGLVWPPEVQAIPVPVDVGDGRDVQLFRTDGPFDRDG